MDDILAEGQSVAPREVLICLLNLSSGGSKLVVVVVIGELATFSFDCALKESLEGENKLAGNKLEPPLQYFVPLILFLMWRPAF